MAGVVGVRLLFTGSFMTVAMTDQEAAALIEDWEHGRIAPHLGGATMLGQVQKADGTLLYVLESCRWSCLSKYLAAVHLIRLEAPPQQAAPGYFGNYGSGRN